MDAFVPEQGLEEPQVVRTVGVDPRRHVRGFLLGQAGEPLLADGRDDLARRVDPEHRHLLFPGEQEDVPVVAPVVAPVLVPAGLREEVLLGHLAADPHVERRLLDVRVHLESDQDAAPRVGELFDHPPLDPVRLHRRVLFADEEEAHAREARRQFRGRDHGSPRRLGNPIQDQRHVAPLPRRVPDREA